jgi:DNA-binding transcriptional LysR family regulator
LRKGHPALKSPLPLQRWLDLRHVTVAPRGGTTIVDRVLAAEGLVRKVALSVPHFLVAPLVVAETDLALMFPERLALRCARDHRLEVVPAPLEVPPFALHVVWHERLQNDAGHAWLRKRMVASVERSSSKG